MKVDGKSARAVILKLGVITPVGVIKPFLGGNEALFKSALDAIKLSISIFFSPSTSHN